MSDQQDATAALRHGQASYGKGPFTGWHMLTLMVLFFGVIISVNVTMAIMAGRTWTGLVVKNSYVESQKFNGYLAAAKEQDERGWRTNLEYRDGRISFQIQGSNGQPVLLENASLHIGRPAFEQADRTIALAAETEGRFVVPISLEPGVWALRITGTSDGHPYRRDSRLTVRASDGVGREDNN